MRLLKALTCAGAAAGAAATCAAELAARHCRRRWTAPGIGRTAADKGTRILAGPAAGCSRRQEPAAATISAAIQAKQVLDGLSMLQ
jgi:hypothetical protein